MLDIYILGKQELYACTPSVDLELGESTGLETFEQFRTEFCFNMIAACADSMSVLCGTLTWPDCCFSNIMLVSYQNYRQKGILKRFTVTSV